jgi:DNA-binding winged helix-turn-helix (wHTH) protein
MRAQFAGCVFDSGRRQLLRDGATVSLTPKAFALLEELVKASPVPVRKEDLYDRLWPGTFVEPGNLHNLISEIRNALGADARSVLKTVHRFGYALVTESSVTATPCYLRSGDRKIPLHDGVNVIGREEDADVIISSPDISRRHAAITIGGDGTWIEDLGSKNGTFLGKRRLTAPASLSGGDEIFLGRYRVTFHVERDASTKTITGIHES